MDENSQEADDERGNTEPELGENVVREERKAGSPYGDEIRPRTLHVESTVRRDLQVTVYDPDEDREVYYLDVSIHGTHDGVKIGKPGDYDVEVVVDGEEHEDVWEVGSGFTDATVVITEDEVGIGVGRHSGNLYVTRVSSLPPGVEPTPYEEVEGLEPVAAAFDRLDECDREDSHDYCLFPPEGAWEEMGDPREHTTVEYGPVRGRDYGVVLNFMTAEERESADILQDEAEELGYRKGHYVEREGEYYAFVLSSGLSPSQRGGPMW